MGSHSKHSPEEEKEREALKIFERTRKILIGLRLSQIVVDIPILGLVSQEFVAKHTPRTIAPKYAAAILLGAVRLVPLPRPKPASLTSSIPGSSICDIRTPQSRPVSQTTVVFVIVKGLRQLAGRDRPLHRRNRLHG